VRAASPMVWSRQALSESGGCTKRDPVDPPQIGCIAIHLRCLWNEFFTHQGKSQLG
jgi:hypothetical protein